MLRLRRASTEDGAAIQAAHAAAIRVTCRGHYPAADIEAWADRLTPRSYDESIARRDVVVAEEEGGIAGFGVLGVEQCEVRAVYVHPDAGRRGVGRALLDALEAIARLRGLREVRLDSSLNAVGFYAAAGWRRLGDTRHTFPGGLDIPCVAMTKTLPASSLTLRDEAAADAGGVDAVERAAFERDGEARLVARLRDAGVLTLSLVATFDGEIVGHAALSPVVIAGATASVLGLGPVAVTPAYQRCAIGARLVEEILSRARERGHGAVVVLGHPEYYPRFGFMRASTFGLRYTAPVRDEAFMAAELVPGALAPASGAVRYRTEFDEV
jgi:putative acetyltransferase